MLKQEAEADADLRIWTVAVTAPSSESGASVRSSIGMWLLDGEVLED